VSAYRVEFTARALKALKRIDRTQAGFIMAWIHKRLMGCSDPRLSGKALTGDKKGYWRYRVGVYRIIADIDDSVVTVTIVTVGHRRDVYD
jgi:mRNA interferase RelE/StbE